VGARRADLARRAAHAEAVQNSVIFGSIHGCSLKQNVLKPNGSTYTASRGDDFLVSGDKNFRPINLRWGPAGDIYLIDWHDQNPCHQTDPTTGTTSAAACTASSSRARRPKGGGLGEARRK
jgi:hypothetical protein